MRLINFLNEKVLHINEDELKDISKTIKLCFETCLDKNNYDRILVLLNVMLEKYNIRFDVGTGKEQLNDKLFINKIGTDKDGKIYIYFNINYLEIFQKNKPFRENFYKKLETYLSHELVHREQIQILPKTYDWETQSSGALKKIILSHAELINDPETKKLYKDYATLEYMKHEHELMAFAKQIVNELVNAKFTKNQIKKLFTTKSEDELKKYAINENLYKFMLILKNTSDKNKFKKFLRYIYEYIEKVEE